MVKRLAEVKTYGESVQFGERLDEVKAIALISHRLKFYVALYSLAETLSSGYLRYVTGVNKERTLLNTIQPSEPILAFVSAQEMLKHRDRRLSAVEALYDNAVKGFIHLGDAGEVVAALVLMFAFDKAHGLRDPTPIKFSVFMETLLPTSIVTEVRGRVHDSNDLQAMWENGFVFFNHFVRLSDRPSEETLNHAYARSAAIFPPVGFKGCDIVIPVHVQGQPRMSYLIVQVNNRRDDSMVRSLKEEARGSLLSAANLVPDAPSYMAILMSLRGKSPRTMEVVYPGPPSEYQLRSSDSTRKYKWSSTERVIIVAGRPGAGVVSRGWIWRSAKGDGNDADLWLHEEPPWTDFRGPNRRGRPVLQPPDSSGLEELVVRSSVATILLSNIDELE